MYPEASPPVGTGRHGQGRPWLDTGEAKASTGQGQGRLARGATHLQQPVPGAHARHGHQAVVQGFGVAARGAPAPAARSVFCFDRCRRVKAREQHWNEKWR
jgi:hypothetical protein